MSDLQQLQNLRDKAIQEGQDTTAIDQQIADLEAQQGQHAERLQQQAADLEDIQLPQDYNAIFGDPRANDEITNLLRQVKEQMYSQHNDELLDVHESYQAKQKASDEAQTYLQERYDALKVSYDKLANELNVAVTAKQLQEDDLKDAIAKRDNAASQLAEALAERDKALKDVDGLKGQINELEGMVRTYKKPTIATGLKLTSTIADETAEERQARLKREETERINARLADRGIDPLPLPDLPVKVTDEDIKQQTQVVQEAADEAEQFPSVVQGDSAGSAAESGAEEALEDADAPGEGLTLEGLNQRLEALEKVVYWQKGQVVA